MSTEEKEVWKHTPGPLTVRQLDKFPFYIETINSDGKVVFKEDRYAFGTGQETVSEVMAGSCFKGKDRKLAIEANES